MEAGAIRNRSTCVLISGALHYHQLVQQHCFRITPSVLKFFGKISILNKCLSTIDEPHQHSLEYLQKDIFTKYFLRIVRKGGIKIIPPVLGPPHFLKSTLPGNRSSQVFLINRNATVLS